MTITLSSNKEILNRKLVNKRCDASIHCHMSKDKRRHQGLTRLLASSCSFTRQLINQKLIAVSHELRHLLSSHLIVCLLCLACNDYQHCQSKQLKYSISNNYLFY